MYVQCCVCKRFRYRAGWLPLPLSFEPEQVTHTYCPGCADRAMIDMNKYGEIESEHDSPRGITNIRNPWPAAGSKV